MDLKCTVFLLFLLSICTGFPELPPPENLRIESENFVSVLHWTTSTISPAVRFTVQYRSNDREKWRNVSLCAPTSARHCNFSSTSQWQNLTLRVRAEDGSQHSDWRESQPFLARIQTRLGPPLITLFPRPHSLIVQMEDPVPTLYYEYGDLRKYRVFYGEEDGTLMEHGDYLSQVTLESLKGGVTYCVKVEYVLYHHIIPDSHPRTECALIPESDDERVNRIVIVAVVVIVLVGGLIVGCLFAGSRHYNQIKETLRPPLDLPGHIYEFFEGEIFTQQISTSSSNAESFENVFLVIDEEEDAAPGHTGSFNDSLSQTATVLGLESSGPSELDTESQASLAMEEEKEYSKTGQEL